MMEGWTTEKLDIFREETDGLLQVKASGKKPNGEKWQGQFYMPVSAIEPLVAALKEPELWVNDA